MIFRALVTILTIQLLTGCVATTIYPSPSPVKTSAGTIGVIFLTADSPVHAHVGTTIFNNFEVPLDQDWGFEGAVLQTISETLGTSYEVKSLQISRSQFGGKETTRMAWNSRPIREEVRAQLDRIAAEEGAVALIVVEPVSRQVDKNTPVNAKGYGVYTRCMFGFCTFNYLDAYEIQIMSVPSSATYAGKGDYFQVDRSVKVDIDNKLIKRLSSVDLTPVRDRLLYAVQQDVKTALANAGLLGTEEAESLDRGYIAPEPVHVDMKTLTGS